MGYELTHNTGLNVSEGRYYPLGATLCVPALKTEKIFSIRAERNFSIRPTITSQIRGVRLYCSGNPEPFHGRDVAGVLFDIARGIPLSYLLVRML